MCSFSFRVCMFLDASGTAYCNSFLDKFVKNTYQNIPLSRNPKYEWPHFKYSSTAGLKSKNHLVQHNKQYHRKVLLSSFSCEWPTL